MKTIYLKVTDLDIEKGWFDNLRIRYWLTIKEQVKKGSLTIYECVTTLDHFKDGATYLIEEAMKPVPLLVDEKIGA